MNNRETCYGCDYFFNVAELQDSHVEGYAIKLCTECANDKKEAVSA